MTTHSFKNGITVIIPDDIQNQLEEWTNVKVIMSILLRPPTSEPVNLYKIFNTIWPPLKQRPKLKSRKSYHRTKKLK